MNNYKNVLTSLLSQTGELIMSYRSHNVTEEKEKNEIVTPADIAANAFLVKELKKAFPDIEIYTEEGKENKSQTTTRWIVDPIDGTTPWVWGNSGFAISVALEENNEIIVGAVYDPVMKEFFYAEKGKGATRNGESIKPAKNIPQNEMLLVVDWGNSDEKRTEGLTYFKKFFIPEMFARRIVPQWAPALGLCHIAEGRIHGLVCNDTWVEDHSAGALILQEAGGFCSNFYQTKQFSHRTAGIIATNEESTHSSLVTFLQN
jgi:myo-inositol-1(or 4)-monophosphatase